MELRQQIQRCQSHSILRSAMLLEVAKLARSVHAEQEAEHEANIGDAIGRQGGEEEQPKDQY